MQCSFGERTEPKRLVEDDDMLLQHLCRRRVLRNQTTKWLDLLVNYCPRLLETAVQVWGANCFHSVSVVHWRCKVIGERDAHSPQAVCGWHHHGDMCTCLFLRRWSYGYITNGA